MPEDKVLHFSPFDNLLSYYRNPKRLCGYFNLLSGVATKSSNLQVQRRVENPEDMLNIFDSKLAAECSDYRGLAHDRVCKHKRQAKENLLELFETIRQRLLEVGRQEDLTFYWKVPCDGAS